MLGFFAPWLLVLVITGLHLTLPGRWITGYVPHERTGEPLRYRLNGLRVNATLVAAWALAGWLDWVPWSWLFVHRVEGLVGACVLGLLYTAAMVLPARATGRGLAIDLFLGRRINPQLLGGRLDHKMWLYLVGAVILQLNVLSFAAHHALTHSSDPSPGIVLCAGLLTYFVNDYLVFERVHLYTYDLFAERVGFKLGWGCLVFYPYFYTIALWFTADLPNPHTPLPVLVGIGVLFLAGWSMARGANMQKFRFKTRPSEPFLGIAPQVVTDGDRSLLVNGFWGVSRHVNYLGEITMGLAIAASAGWWALPWPWLYPLYYVLLLVPRQRDDDARCAEKYGPLWEEYVRKVPSRIVPGIY
ncbi:MAG: DUF1295 domain-containing protein [Myxococcales bacterium]|nr:DUF1295 domain-containing protein [Myxococcales bacterium]